MITKKVCYTSTLYTLLLYLLYCDDKDLDETLYILDTSFPKDSDIHVNYLVLKHVIGLMCGKIGYFSGFSI